MSTSERSARRPLFAPEVIQTSAMDCGPAALKCLLEGFGVPVSYGRLREACHTSVDGTSIDTLESLACALGLEAEQITLPVEHIVLPEAAALPALVVVTLPSGMTHFVVVWRVHGSFVQVMDPGRGRRWQRVTDFLREVYVHENRVPAVAFRDWVGSDGFLDPLRARLRRLGASQAETLVARALSDPGWRTMAALDAAVRATEALVADAGLPRGRTMAALNGLFEAGTSQRDGRQSALGGEFWMARAADDDAEPSDATEPEEVLVRGAIALRVVGRSVENADEPRAALSPEIAAVARSREPGPAAKLMELLAADGFWRWPPLVVGIALAALGATFEAVLFRGLLDIGRHLAIFEQRLAAMSALVLLVTALLGLEWPVMRGLWGIGRRLEDRLRRAFSRKLFRVGDPYFQSRPISDLAERAHLVHWLRVLPGQAGLLLRATCELLVTTVGIVWLHPPSAPFAIGLAVATVGIPLLFQPALIERDLRMRAHAGGLARFYLDALLGLVPIRAHAAEEAIKREHGDRLGEWARAAWSAARLAVIAESLQMLVGFGLAAWLLIHHLVGAAGSGWTLLLAYWALALPVLGQEIAFLIQQYPQHRNVTFRLLEPLGAPESAGLDGPVVAAGTGRKTSRKTGAEIRMTGVTVQVAGQQIVQLDDLAIAPGSHVAIVGPSGGGKTSLVGLLLGWHEPTDGQVLVDGGVLTAARVRELRRETAWVEPGVYLWNRTLLENLRFGTDGSRAVGASVEEAELDEVLARLPAGLETCLGEGGGLLSGGEGQRVRFGRAVHRGPVRLVVLDEAFRGLERSRRKLLLHRARARWSSATMLCITHDIADTIEFDRVLVVDGGRIVEDGLPRTLADDRKSRYHALLAAEKRVQLRLRGDGWRRLRLQAGRLVEPGKDSPP
jgi:ABC-type bacteriocin/lantibiotic exporter with double-glycine peptidase domain